MVEKLYSYVNDTFGSFVGVLVSVILTIILSHTVTWLLVALGALSSFIIVFLIAFESRKRKLKKQKENERLLREKINPAIQIITDSTSKLTMDMPGEFQPVERYIELLRMLPSGSAPSINVEYQKQLESLANRIEYIESKFPSKETNVEKIASINDAIFLTKIDGLSKVVENLERKMLSKWDVAKIIFTILGVLAAIIGLVVAVLK